MGEETRIKEPLLKVHERLDFCLAVLEKWGNLNYKRMNKEINMLTAQLLKLQEEEGPKKITEIKNIQDELSKLLNQEEVK